MMQHRSFFRRGAGLASCAAAAVLALLWAGIPSAPADVYTEAPSGGRSAGSAEDVLQPQVFLREAVSVNGRAGELSVGTARLSAEEALAAVKAGGGGWKIRSAGGASFVVEEPAGDSGLRRHYVYSAGGGKTTLVFSLRMPPAKDGGTAAEWPKEIPQPQGTAETVMRLEKANATFAVAGAAGTAEMAARSYDEALLNAGWNRLSAAPAAGSTRGEYRHAKTSRLLVFQAGDSPDGGSTVSVFCSPIR